MKKVKFFGFDNGIELECAVNNFIQSLDGAVLSVEFQSYSYHRMLVFSALVFYDGG